MSKALKVTLSVLAAVATVAGIVYVVATYGDRIVKWAKGLLKRSEMVIYDYEGNDDDVLVEDTEFED